jgi:thiol-disulfide isomerase/thioredoxin
MRLLPSLFVATLIVTAAASSQPLSNKEIALMLRSGYSSDSVLVEITRRGALEPLDPATKKSLLEFGASPHLIAALGSAAYAVSDSEAEKLKQREADLVARRAALAKQNATSAQPAQNPQAGAGQPPPGDSIMRGLRDKLIVSREGVISHADDAGLENKKLIALYFSAHWCGPCRKFTPQLVDYYNQVEPQHPEFEVIFVSCDRSRFGWETYMREARMPWPAIDYDQLAGLAGLKQLSGDGIPSLVLLDGSGHLLSSSYDGTRYLGPEKVIADLQKIFTEGTAAPLVQAR